MKKTFLVAGFVFAMALAASAQTKKKVPPPPPKPPKPPIEIVNDVPPPPPPPPPLPPAPLTDEELTRLPEDFQDFMRRNPTVGSVHWNEDAIFIVPKKGKVERYTLDEKGIAQAEAKYGRLPKAPPPPPAPPKPPVPPKY